MSGSDEPLTSLNVFFERSLVKPWLLQEKLRFGVCKMENKLKSEIHGVFQVPIDWDVLVAASHSCLDGYARGFVEKEIINQLPGNIIYRIWQQDLGELGTIEIRKLRAGLSQIKPSGIPLGVEQINTKSDEVYREELRGQGLTPEKVREAVHEKWRQNREQKEKRREQLKDHQAKVISAYFSRLIQEVEIWSPNFPPPYMLVIGGFVSVDDAYKRGEYFGNFIRGAWNAAQLAIANQSEGQPENKVLSSEIMQIEKISQNHALQNALRLYIFNPEMTLADIAKATKYKSLKSLATLISSVRKEIIQKWGEERANELLPHRKSNSSWRKTH